MLFGLALVAVLLGVLIALVVDRRLRQARRDRERSLLRDEVEAKKVARELRRIGCRTDADRIEARLDLEARRQLAQSNLSGECPGRRAESGTAGVPRPPKSGPPTAMQSGAHARTGIGSGSQPAPAPCPTTQPHHYLPGGIYAPAADSRSDRSDCGGSSWSGSSDSGSSSCDSSSSSGGGGE